MAEAVIIKTHVGLEVDESPRKIVMNDESWSVLEGYYKLYNVEARRIK